MNRIKSRIMNLLLGFLLNLRFKFGIYILLLRAIEIYQPDNRNSEITAQQKWNNESLLVLNKTGLMEDLSTVIATSNTQLPKLVVVPRFFVNLLAERFLSERQRQDFLPNSEYDPEPHLKYQELWNYLLKKISVKFRTKLMITANFTYGNQRDIYEVAKAHNWEVIVLYKECFMSKANAENRIRLMSNARPFSGTKILVYNQDEVYRQLLTGNIKKEQIAVTGSPRFDSLILHGEKLIHENQGKIIFFAQDYVSKLNYWQMTQDQISFSKKHNQQIVFGLDSTLRAAQNFPHLSFEIKSKVTLITQEVISEWAKNQTIPNNLRITLGGGLAKNSLTNCIAAFGFNTTALVDALAVGATIAVLRYEIEENQFSDFIIPYDGAETIREYRDLVNWIERIVSEVGLDSFFRLKLSETALNYLEKAVGNRDSMASTRVVSELIKIDSNRESSHPVVRTFH